MPRYLMLFWQKAITTSSRKKTRHEREVKELRVRGIGNRRVRERKQGHMRTKLIQAYMTVLSRGNRHHF